MKKGILILSVIALFVAGCGQQTKKQTGTSASHPDNTQTVNETCLIFVCPEEQNFEDENSEEAERYFTIVDDFVFYSSETAMRFKEAGINCIAAEKRYLSFILDNNEKYIVDTKKQGNFDALLYKKGQTPILVDIVVNDFESIADYLGVEIMELSLQENDMSDEYEESGDPGIVPFIEGIYRNTGSNDGCRIFLNITKSDDGYSFGMLVNDKQFNGTVSVSAVENYITLEGIPWVSNDGPPDNDGNRVKKKKTTIYGIDAMWEDHDLVIQNSGNSMNSYTKLDCDEKFIRLVKETGE